MARLARSFRPFVCLALIQPVLSGCAGSELADGRSVAVRELPSSQMALLTRRMETGRMSERESRRLSRLWIASATRSPAEFEKRWSETEERVSQVHRQLDLMKAGKEPDSWPNGPWLAAMRTARTPAKNAGRPQTYGTQGECAAGSWKPHIITDPERLDSRRREAGLEPHREYLNSMRCF